MQEIYAAAARRDSVTPFSYYAEDIVWDASNAPRLAALWLRPVYHGHEGVRQSWRDGLDAFSEVTLEVGELIDAEDQVLAAVRERDVGRTSGVPVERMHFAVWTLADGKVTRMRIFEDRSAALEAAGVPA